MLTESAQIADECVNPHLRIPITKVERVNPDQVEFGPFQLPDGDPEIAAQGLLLASCGSAHSCDRDNHLFGHDPTVRVRPSTSDQRKEEER